MYRNRHLVESTAACLFVALLAGCSREVRTVTADVPQIAGRLPNTPDDLVRWIRFPQRIDPGNGMPDLSVTERDARDLAAYLYTLKSAL